MLNFYVPEYEIPGKTEWLKYWISEYPRVFIVTKDQIEWYNDWFKNVANNSSYVVPEEKEVIVEQPVTEDSARGNGDQLDEGYASDSTEDEVPDLEETSDDECEESGSDDECEENVRDESVVLQVWEETVQTPWKSRLNAVRPNGVAGYGKTLNMAKDDADNSVVFETGGFAFRELLGFKRGGSVITHDKGQREFTINIEDQVYKEMGFPDDQLSHSVVMDGIGYATDIIIADRLVKMHWAWMIQDVNSMQVVDVLPDNQRRSGLLTTLYENFSICFGAKPVYEYRIFLERLCPEIVRKYKLRQLNTDRFWAYAFYREYLISRVIRLRFWRDAVYKVDRDFLCTGKYDDFISRVVDTGFVESGQWPDIERINPLNL